MTPGPAARWWAGGLLVLSLAARAAAASSSLSVVITPARPRPGDVVLIHVTAAPADLGGEWGGRPLPFFPVRGGMAALVGVDLDVAPGPVAWRVTRPDGARGAPAVRAGAVSVVPRAFATQHLSLPRSQVDLDAPTLARVRTEQAEMQAVLAAGAGERLWRGPFLRPVEEGRPGSEFGLRRIINGQPRSPHTGYDWAAPLGTPVRAANAGRVALVAEHFFSGRLVVLDHGLGLFTLYFHLAEVGVSVGESVAGGQRIGAVGATGRATGPHLHFAVSLHGARVDPLTLLALTPPADE